MNSQPIIIEGLSNDRRQNLYRDASAIRTSENSRRLTNQVRNKGGLESLSSILGRLGVASRPASVNVGSVTGR